MARLSPAAPRSCIPLRRRAASQPLRPRKKVAFKFRESRRRRFTTRDHHDVDPLRPTAAVPTINLTQAPLHKIPHHRVPHLRGDRDAETAGAKRRGHRQHHQARRGVAKPSMLNTQKVGALLQTLRLSVSLIRSRDLGGRSHRALLRGDLNAQALTALRATTTKNVATAFGRHTLTETMNAGALDVARLKGAFHGDLLYLSLSPLGAVPTAPRRASRPARARQLIENIRAMSRPHPAQLRPKRPYLTPARPKGSRAANHEGCSPTPS